jgi:hypothetical protein
MSLPAVHLLAIIHPSGLKEDFPKPRCTVLHRTLTKRGSNSSAAIRARSQPAQHIIAVYRYPRGWMRTIGLHY